MYTNLWLGVNVATSIDQYFGDVRFARERGCMQRCVTFLTNQNNKQHQTRSFSPRKKTLEPAVVPRRRKINIDQKSLEKW